MVKEEVNEEERENFSGENPGEISEEKQKALLNKQKEFEYKEIYMAREGLKEEIKIEKTNTIFRWILVFIVTLGLGFLYWYLIL